MNGDMLKLEIAEINRDVAFKKIAHETAHQIATKKLNRFIHSEDQPERREYKEIYDLEYLRILGNLTRGIEYRGHSDITSESDTVDEPDNLLVDKFNQTFQMVERLKSNVDKYLAEMQDTLEKCKLTDEQREVLSQYDNTFSDRHECIAESHSYECSDSIAESHSYDETPI